MPLSFNYQLYIWRMKMKVDYQAMLETPMEVIMRDLQYMNIEGEVRQLKEKQANAKSK